MPEKTVKRRPQDCDAALAFDDGLSSRPWPRWSTQSKVRSASCCFKLRLGPRRLAFDQIRGDVRAFVG